MTRPVVPAFGETDLPALYRAADGSSLDGQRQYRRLTAFALGLLVLAAIGGAVTTDFGPGTTDWGGVTAAAAFLGSLLCQADIARRRPERAWYEGRALAESAKSLAWQYAVAGGRYGRAVDSADASLREDLEALLRDIGEARPFEVTPPGAQITEGMKRLRSADLRTQRDTYLDGRIRDQRAWYAGKARVNRTRARTWMVCVVLLQCLGGFAAILKATGTIEIDLLGIAAALVASILGWIQLNAHVQLDEAYSLASHELSLIEGAGEAAATEEDWATYVADAEQAISREHRMWRAARSGGHR